MERLRVYIHSLIDLSEEAWKALSPALTTVEYKKGDCLLQEGQACNNLFFISAGYCRAFYRCMPVRVYLLRTMIERHLAVNLFGTHCMTRAFLPSLIRSHGAIVNILSILALAPLPPTASYSISKAAAFSLTQSMRAFLAGQGVKVHAVLAGPTDTDLIRHMDIPKTSPEMVVKGIFDGVEREEEDIFPDPQSAPMAESWFSSASKMLERRFAALVSAKPASTGVRL